MTWPYTEFIDALFAKVVLENRGTLRNKKRYGDALAAMHFFRTDIAEELQKYPLHVFPEGDQLMAYLQDSYQDLRTLRGLKQKLVYLESLKISLRDQRTRQIIEVLTILSYKPEKIHQVLQKHGIIENKIDIGDIEQYLKMFFNFTCMDEISRSEYFRLAQGVLSLRLQCQAFYNTRTEEQLLAYLRIQPDGESNLERIYRNIGHLVMELEQALIEKNFKRAASITQMLSQLSNCYSKLGGDNEGDNESFSDYIELITTEFKPDLTVEEMREHNARVMAEEQK